jgi:nitric oxide reductase NorD protein
MTDLSEQKKRFYATVFPSRPNEWEVDEVFDHLAGLPGEVREKVLSQVEVIWPVSHSLCFTYLIEGAAALRLFSADLLPEWVRRLLGIYEKKGLAAAREYMADVDKQFLGPMRGEAGVALDEISAMLLPYIRGVSGLPLHIDCAVSPGTDTRTIYLPSSLDQFPERKKNVLFYKLMVTLQWGQIVSGIYQEVLGEGGSGQERDPLAGYADKALASDLLAVLQFQKVFGFLAVELPGLIRQGRDLCVQLIGKIGPNGTDEQQSKALRGYLMQSVGDRDLAARRGACAWDASCFDLLPDLYAQFAPLGGSYRLGPFALLLGELNFQRAGENISLRRIEEKRKFVTMFAAYLDSTGTMGDGSLPKEHEEAKAETLSADALALLHATAEQSRKDGQKERLIDIEGMKLPEALVALVNDIVQDLGNLPQAYVQAAAGLAGKGVNSREGTKAVESVQVRADAATYRYNEWDYRRGGYRTDWCTLEEKSLSPVRSGFVAGTLEKYRPQLKRLRRQFELLRTCDRIVRRQRDGDDIDLDAVIEALGDIRAGLPPSDRLFSRLLRDERDITAMFLVDMSNSTEGWIGVALKETLVLLAEALEVVGDRYGIYGFSGMRRSRSELFHIKHPEELYGAVVQQRIAAVMPKEYTRMGPPIRHLTRKLLDSAGRVRLLVVISDGKPEDYDDYKGQYAIEDTRKALLEARGAGVYPFCITIDRSAHEYLAHMFGRGNYIFVNDVKSLPAKMVHMYRVLTS